MFENYRRVTSLFHRTLVLTFHASMEMISLALGEERHSYAHSSFHRWLLGASFVPGTTLHHEKEKGQINVTFALKRRHRFQPMAGRQLSGVLRVWAWG